MSMSKAFAIAAFAISLTILFCSKNPVSEQAEKVDGGNASFYFVADARSDFRILAHHAEVRVSAPDIDTIIQELKVDSFSVSGTISGIPAGFNRKFEVTVYTDSNTICYYGRAFTDIVGGKTTNVSLTLYRYTGTGDANINGLIVDSIPSSINIPPFVKITSPANNARFFTGDTFSIVAEASDSDGVIKSVLFYDGPTLLAIDTVAPYNYLVFSIEAGVHSYKCVAYDDLGDSTVSLPIEISIVDEINILPSVKITSPADNSSFLAGDSFFISAEASDSDGTIKLVHFYNGDILIHVDTLAPYNYLVINAEAGKYSFRCVAYDNSGDSAVSNAVNVTVVGKTNMPPSVKITSPANESNYFAGDSFSISAEASDTDGTIKSVLFYDGDKLLNIDTVAPFNYFIENAAVGSYNFTCVAYDNSGDSAVSTVVKVNIAEKSDLLSKYGVPSANPFPSLERKYSVAATEGTGAPSLSNITIVQINWSKENNGLWSFGINTNDGNPSWWIDLTTKIKHSFGEEKPECTISGSGFAGLDGEYYVTMDKENMVLVEKSGSYAVIFK